MKTLEFLEGYLEGFKAADRIKPSEELKELIDFTEKIIAKEEMKVAETLEKQYLN